MRIVGCELIVIVIFRVFDLVKSFMCVGEKVVICCWSITIGTCCERLTLNA